jgi:hypothetical protein
MYIQRAPQPSGAEQSTSFTRPRVSLALEILQRARELACNAPADLTGALNLMKGLEQWMDDVANPERREEVFESLGFAKETAMQASGHSVDAVSSLRRRIALWQSDTDTTTPMHRSTWDYHVSEFEIGMEFLEVLTGERQLSETVAPALEEGAWTSIDVLLATMPVIGTALIAGEAIAGRDLAGHKLSGLQRAVLGGVAILSELGPLIRAARATTDAARLAALAKADVAVLKDISRARAVGLVAGARSLTASERSTLKQLARIVEAGGKLGPKEMVQANGILGKISEQGLVAEALERNASKLEGAKGLVVDEGTNLTPKTRSVGEKLLATGRFKQGLALAERPGQGVKTGDFVMDGQLVEGYQPETPRVDKVISEIASYHRQAGTFAVDLAKTSITRAELIEQLPRLWGKPEATDIGLVIVIDGDQVVDVARPANFTLPDVAAATSPALGAGTKAGQ